MRAASLVLLAGCVGGTSLPEVDDPCATWEAPGVYALPVPGFDRRPIVRMPATAGPRTAVIMLHGAGGSAEHVAQSVTRLLDEAERDGFVAVFPNGSGPPGGYTWNAGGCCGVASNLQTDDLAFLDALADEVRRRACVDRVVAAGHSNGGMMALRWACESDAPDAAFSAAGPLLQRSCRALRGPVTYVHGTDDPVVPFDGGRNEDRVDFPAAEAAVGALREAGGCLGEPETEVVDATTCRTWRGCEAPVRFCAIEGWRHAWPGGKRQLPDGFDAEDEVRALLGVSGADAPD